VDDVASVRRTQAEPYSRSHVKAFVVLSYTAPSMPLSTRPSEFDDGMVKGR
jgi:hypothetical protein